MDNLTYFGQAPDGEIEDYCITIEHIDVNVVVNGNIIQLTWNPIPEADFIKFIILQIPMLNFHQVGRWYNQVSPEHHGVKISPV